MHTVACKRSSGKKRCGYCDRMFSPKAYTEHLVEKMCNVMWKDRIEREAMLRRKQERLFEAARSVYVARQRHIPSLEVATSSSSGANILLPVANDDWLEFWKSWDVDRDCPYACLGFKTAVSIDVVKKRVRRLVRITHPDKCSDNRANDAFHAIMQAKKKILEG